MMRARYAALPAALLALSLAACSAPEGQSTQGGSASADTLNIACSQQEDFCQAIVAAYTRETGQKATYVRLGAGEVLARLETNPGEFDVWSGGQAENHLVANDKGKIEKYVSKNASALPSQYNNAEGIWSGFYTDSTAPTRRNSNASAHRLPPPGRTCSSPNSRGALPCRTLPPQALATWPCTPSPP